MNDTSSLAHTTWNCKYHIVRLNTEEKYIMKRNVEKQGNSASVVQMERSRNNRSKRPRTHVFENTPEDKCIWIHGISQRKKQCTNIFQICKYEIQVQKQRILVPWLLCRHGRKNTRKIKEYIASQLAEDKRLEQMTIFEVNDPFKK